MDDFARQVVDLTAHEQITQETLGEAGRRKSSEYSYLVVVHRNDLSGSSPEEYRVDAKGNRVAPAACIAIISPVLNLVRRKHCKTVQAAAEIGFPETGAVPDRPFVSSKGIFRQ